MNIWLRRVLVGVALLVWLAGLVWAYWWFEGRYIKAFERPVFFQAEQVAPLLRLTAEDLVSLGIADTVVPDDTGATVAALVAALDEAEVGDRGRRLDAATAAWLRT